MTPEEQQQLQTRQKSKNLAVAAGLSAFMLVVFIITFLKLYLA